MLEQSVLPYWNTLFCLEKQIVFYRRIKLKLVCCRIFVTFSFSFLG